MTHTCSLSNEEFSDLDLFSPEAKKLCHDIEPRHLVATVAANSVDEAITKVAKEHRYDKRVLYAEEAVTPHIIRGNKMFQTIRNCFPYTASAVFIAMAVVLDNRMETNMSEQDWHRFQELAFRISNEMVKYDEPRFSLYDYMDATVNHKKADWKELHLSFLLRPKATFDRIVQMAEDERRNYES